MADDTNDHSMLLRVGGPHPQTELFKRHDGSDERLWEAQFRLCLPGEYSVHVLLVMASPWGSGSRWQRSCAVHHKNTSVLVERHSWVHRTPQPRGQSTLAHDCPGLWVWPCGDRDINLNSFCHTGWRAFFLDTTSEVLLMNDSTGAVREAPHGYRYARRQELSSLQTLCLERHDGCRPTDGWRTGCTGGQWMMASWKPISILIPMLTARRH